MAEDTVGAITSEDLEGFDVLVLTNRVSQGYSVAELEAITAFVTQSGKGLWCMANHAAFSTAELSNNHVRYDSAVSTTFWVAYEPAAYSVPGSSSPVLLTGDNLADHPVITGESDWPLASGSSSQAIGTIATRSFCGVTPNAFTTAISGMADLPGVVNIQDGQPVTSGALWAAAVSSSVTGEGRVIIGADAGWLGNTSSDWPGPGEFQNADNPQFALNCMSWLGGLGSSGSV